LAAQALGPGPGQPRGWRAERIRRGVGAATGGIYRLSGSAEQGGQSLPWSCILKVITPVGAAPVDPTHPLYWKRELLAYQSGWLDRPPGVVRGPRRYGNQGPPGAAAARLVGGCRPPCD